MAKLLDDSGKEASVGSSTGYWLADSDFVSTVPSMESATSLGSLGFPRDWPAVYNSSKALKSLVGLKKGRCASKKTAVVGKPTDEELAMVDGLELRSLQSFSNAEKVEKKTGMAVVQGWAIFEHLDMEVSEAFVAERYWWNQKSDGGWLDFTPRPSSWPDLLLAEAANGAPKAQSKLDARGAEVATSLLRQRFGKQVELASPAPASPAPDAKKAAAPAAPAAKRESQPEEPATWNSPPEVRGLVKRIRAGDATAAKELDNHAQGNEELSVLIAKDGVAKPLVQMLSAPDCSEDVVRLVLILTDAGVGQQVCEVQRDFVDAGAVPPVVALLKSTAASLQELAAAILGNLCHENPANQDIIASPDTFQALCKLLSGGVACAQESAYAIWNLTVAHSANSQQVVDCGGVPLLTNLLTSASDVAQENAAGALMHVSMVEAARTAIVQAGAIPSLCKLLLPSCEPEVNTQAAGALLNLASDSPPYGKMIVDEKAIGPLVRLVKDGPDLAREYAAGALMNLIREDTVVAERAANEGAIPALAALLQKGLGQSEALGALANLASGSTERQATIYKAQVTRKSVTLLSDKDLDIRRSAAALIMNLAPHAKIKERIVEAGALPPLVKLLKDADGAVKERSAGALANLFNDHSANVHAGIKQAPSIIEALVEVLKSSELSDDARRQAAHALAMIAAEDGLCDQVWAAGAGPPFLQLLEAGVAEAALGVMNLAWRWPEVKQELAKGQTMAHLLTMLKSDNALGKEYAAGALMNMTAASVENAEKATNAVPLLAELLRAESIQAAEWAAGALANIVRVGPKVQQAAVGASAATSLASLLHKATPEGRSMVVLALTSLADGEDGKMIAVQRALSGAKEKSKLRELKADGANKEVQEYTTALIEKISLTL